MKRPNINKSAFTKRAFHSLINSKLYDLEEYAQRLGGLLKNELKGFTSFVEKEAAKLDEPEKERLYDLYSDDYWKLKDVFPNIVWCSLFITCYSLLEHELSRICESMRSLKECPLKPSDLKDRGIFQSKAYLKKVIGIQFPDNTRYWQEICFYNRIRNRIIHEGGRVYDSENDSKLRAEIDRTSSINLDDYGRILLSCDFVLEVIENLKSFFRDIFKCWQT